MSSTTNASGAERFRVERKGPFRISRSVEKSHDAGQKPRSGFLVIHTGESGTPERFGWLHRDGFFVDDRNDSRNEDWQRIVDGLYFPTEAEATFRLLLYQNPAEALGPFLRATGGAYEGTCPDCGGRGRYVSMGVSADWRDCPTCHGTGGPPSLPLLQVARDWFEEGMEHDVLCDVIEGALLTEKGVSADTGWHESPLPPPALGRSVRPAPRCTGSQAAG